MSPKNRALLFAVTAAALFSTSAYADEDGLSYPSKIGGKLGIGMINAMTGIVELPKTMVVESNKNGVGMGVSVGFLKGMTNMLGRSVMGMLDVVSFPVPTKPLITPPVVFQDFGAETTYGEGWETY